MVMRQLVLAIFSIFFNQMAHGAYFSIKFHEESDVYLERGQFKVRSIIEPKSIVSSVVEADIAAINNLIRQVPVPSDSSVPAVRQSLQGFDAEELAKMEKRMKQDKRTSLKIALASGFLARWATPTIISISLPAHAQTSDCSPVNATLYEGFIASNIGCAVGSPNRLTFDLLNNSGADLTFTLLDSSDGSLTHISPSLPFELAVGESISIEIESTTDCSELSRVGYSVQDAECGGFVPIELTT